MAGGAHLFDVRRGQYPRDQRFALGIERQEGCLAAGAAAPGCARLHVRGGRKHCCSQEKPMATQIQRRDVWTLFKQGRLGALCSHRRHDLRSTWRPRRCNSAPRQSQEQRAVGHREAERVEDKGRRGAPEAVVEGVPRAGSVFVVRAPRCSELARAGHDAVQQHELAHHRRTRRHDPGRARVLASCADTASACSRTASACSRTASRATRAATGFA